MRCDSVLTLIPLESLFSGLRLRACGVFRKLWGEPHLHCVGIHCTAPGFVKFLEFIEFGRVHPYTTYLSFLDS